MAKVKALIYLDEIKVKIVICDFEIEKFSIFPYKLLEIGVFIISIFLRINLGVNWTISEMKASVCEELKNKYKIILDKEFVIIRDYQLEKPTKVKII